jgi:hypothetical protein
MHTQFWSESLKGRDHSEDLGLIAGKDKVVPVLN